MILQYTAQMLVPTVLMIWSDQSYIKALLYTDTYLREQDYGTMDTVYMGQRRQSTCMQTFCCFQQCVCQKIGFVGFV